MVVAKAATGECTKMLPIFKDDNQALMLMQTRWKSELDAVLVNPLNSVNIIKGISLKNGVTVVNHLLGRVMQGWFLTDLDGAALIYRSADFNNKTLTLTSNAAVIVNLGVF